MTDPDSILTNRDFDFQMRFTRGRIDQFYGRTAENESLIAERRRWLERDSSRYLVSSQEATDLVREAESLAASLACLNSLPPEASTSDRCHSLGTNWEPDYLLLSPDEYGSFRLRAGCVCFPSHWDLREKAGKTLAEIHAPVPTLNESLGKQIDGFLHRIRPDISWERANWGLSASPQRNLHPGREYPRLHDSISLDQVWWRLEKQSLVSLPRSGGILFGIRLQILPLSEIRERTEACRGLVRALESMPEEVAEYKGLASSRKHLVELLLGR